MKLHPKAAEARRVIAAYREKHSESPFGPAYGPDWKGRIKGHVVETVQTGKEPYFMVPQIDAQIPAK